MNRILFFLVIALVAFSSAAYAADKETAITAAPQAEIKAPEQAIVAKASNEYTVGVDDVLDINVLQPEKMANQVVVSPDGSISFPYIGNVQVKGMTLQQVEEIVQKKLSEGYMRYPVITVALRESRSRKFFVYGEVVRPGSFPLEDNATVVRAISVAGGFSKYGSSSRVKVLRLRKDKPGYDALKVNINAAMEGNPNEDLLVVPGDIIVVSEGVF